MRLRNVIISVLGVAAFGAAFILHGEPLATSQKVDLEERYLSLDRSPLGLEAYRQEMLLLHKDIQEKRISEVHSTVTFTEPLTIDEAEYLIARFGIEPRLTYAFAVNSEGAMVTIGGKFSRGINAQLSRIVQEEELTLLGVVSVIGSVPSMNLDKLQTDPSVFLVDVSADASLVDNPGNNQYMQHFAWDLWEQAKRPSVDTSGY